MATNASGSTVPTLKGISAPKDEQTLTEILAQIGLAKTRPGSDTDYLPSRLSPSRAGDFVQCPKLFYYKTICGIPTPSTVENARGVLAHEVFERIFDHPAGERTVEIALAYLEPAWADLTRTELDEKEFPPDSKERSQQLDRARDYLALAPAGSETEAAIKDFAAMCVRNWFNIERVNNFDPSSVTLPDGTVVDGRELHVLVNMFDVDLHGFIDRLDRWEDSRGVAHYSVTDYKGLALDTPLPTPSGWTTMADVRVGDQLIAADGSPTTVTVKSEVHHRPCYEVVFDDNSTIVCDNVHLWQVEHGDIRYRVPKVVTADQLYEMVENQTTARRVPTLVMNASPLDLPEADLAVDPYVLGVWLGDGDSDSGAIHASTAKEPHFRAEIASRGYQVTSRADSRAMSVLNVSRLSDTVCSRGHDHPTRRRADGSYRGCSKCTGDALAEFPRYAKLSRQLRALGVLNNKHVPDQYLRGSIHQRLSLLQGLMDTDGSWNSTRNQAVFTTTTRPLAEAVEELVHSLGWRSTRFERPYESRKGPRSAIQVFFTPFGLNPFTMPSKADKVRIEGATKARRRSIRSVRRVESVPTQCVAVDSLERLYLAGRQMVPTHNTGKYAGEGKSYREETMKRISYESFFQLRFYAILCWELFGIRVELLRLLYVKNESREVAVKELRVTEQMINSTKEEIRIIWKGITSSARTGRWNPKTGPLCDYCYFNDVCPVFNPELEGMPISDEQPERKAG